MMREATERCLAEPTAHAMRAAALRLARVGAGKDTDPFLVYGCVDWFRYDASPPPQKMPPLAAALPGTRHGTAPPAH